MSINECINVFINNGLNWSAANPPANLLDPNLPREIQHLSNNSLPLYAQQTSGYGSACIDILISKNSGCGLMDLAPVKLTETIRN